MKRVLAVAVALLAVAGCTPSRHVITHTITQTNEVTQTLTRSPSPSSSVSVRPTPTYSAPPTTTVAPLPPGASPARGEVEKACPYIASSSEENAKTNVADIDGSHVYRTTVLSTLEPVGCRFYFYAPPYYAIVDILPKRFATAKLAYVAMIATAKRGTQVTGKPDIVPGVDAVLYRTKFYDADGSRDWACVFAKGRTMLVIHTQRTDTSLNALLLARAVAGRF